MGQKKKTTKADLEEQIRNLEIAVETRTLIGQAMGILIERHKIRPPEAFDRLVAISQETNTKLRAVAVTIVGDDSAPERDRGDELEEAAEGFGTEA